MKQTALAALLSVALIGPAATADMAGTVSHIVYGGTSDMPTPAGTVRIRFCGIDTPERGQPGAREATEALTQLIQGKMVRCVPVGDGTPCDGRSKPTNCDRVVAQCFLGPDDIALEMVRAGQACEWPRFTAGHNKVSVNTCTR